MEIYEHINVPVHEVIRADLMQLALIDDPIGIDNIRYVGADPVMLLKIEHAGVDGPGEPVHIAIPMHIAALLVGQIDAMVTDKFNDRERARFQDIAARTRVMCMTHPCAKGCKDPAAHAEGAHDV